MRSIIFLTALATTIIVSTIIYQSIDKDWPKLYFYSIINCRLNNECLIDLRLPYGENWDEMVWLPIYNKKFKLPTNKSDEELCERIVFLKSNKVKSYYSSSCLDFPSHRNKKITFNYDENFKVHIKSPYLCVSKVSKYKILPDFHIKKCGID